MWMIFVSKQRSGSQMMRKAQIFAQWFFPQGPNSGVLQSLTTKRHKNVNGWLLVLPHHLPITPIAKVRQKILHMLDLVTLGLDCIMAKHV